MIPRKGQLYCLAAATLLLLYTTRHHPLQPPSTVSATTNDASTMKFTDLFKSDQLSAFLSQFQQQSDSSQNNGQRQSNTKNNQQQTSQPRQSNHPDEGQRHPNNRRMLLYELSLQSHYEQMMEQHNNSETDSIITNNDYHQTSRKDTSSNNKDNDSNNSSSSKTKKCTYYNPGLDTSYNVREMIRREDNLFNQFSHWTLKLCRGEKLAQIHLEAVPLSSSSSSVEKEDDNDGDGCKDDDECYLRLPSTSLLVQDIQFLIPVRNDLGGYADPMTISTHEFDSALEMVWNDNEDEDEVMMTDDIEYYVKGDLCSYENDGQVVTMQRQSAVLYDKECCERQRRTMDEFFPSDDEIMILSSSEPLPCQYVIRACNICQSDNEAAKKSTTAPHTTDDEVSSIHNDSKYYSELQHLLQSYIHLSTHTHDEQSNSASDNIAFPPMPPSQIEANKQLLHQMFTHAWDSYMYNAFPASELKPLTCSPGTFDLVRIPALTLIDTLDTLIIMSNFTEFARSVERLRYFDQSMQREFHESGLNKGSNLRKGEQGGIFSINQNVSVFETTIRVLGGLLSAHQLAEAFMGGKVLMSDVWDASGEIRWGAVESDLQSLRGDNEQYCTWDSASNQEMDSDCGSNLQNDNESRMWTYDGFLLKLATDIGNRLWHAFHTATGIPYGTVNLLYGVPPKETTVASLAGAGTLTLEFELLSRLTGDLKFGKAAKLATRALWVRRSEEMSLFGKHIDVMSGRWVEHLSGIGSNSDSFYEYLIKHHILFPDDADFWTMFVNVYSGIHDSSRLGEWYVDVDMTQGLRGNVRQIFESLMAFYPGMQILLGELAPAANTLNSFFLVREFLGLLPERFDFAHWKVDGNGDLHPLRPELLESNYFLHLASIGLHGSKNGPCSQKSSSTYTSSWLWAADFALHALNKLSRKTCGFAAVKKVSPTTTGGLDLVRGNRDPRSVQRRRRISHHNEMPSFLLTETIKYLYLTFDAENNILHRDSEREWVFTTEAHPIHHEPVSSTPVLSSEDKSLGAQVDKVRSLMRKMMSGVSSEDDQIEESGEEKNNTKHLTFEIWSRSTRKLSHMNSITKAEGNILARKQEKMRKNGFTLGPRFLQGRSNVNNNSSIFSEDVNLALHHFDNHGRDHGLGKHCPNFHHPDLIWTHALNGNTLDYKTQHHPVVNDEKAESSGVQDQRVHSALAAACFYGTDYHADHIRIDRNKTCSAEDDPNYKSDKKAKQDEIERMTSATIPGSTRYDLGKDMGLFDVSAFVNGDGFVVRQVNSGELLEVSIFYDELDLPAAEIEGTDTNGIDSSTLSGATVLSVLTLPIMPEASNRTPLVKKEATSLSSWTLNGWRKQLNESGNGKNITNNSSQDETAHFGYERRVVIADLEGNQFSCEVILTDDMDKNYTFPCAPGVFGKTNIAELAKTSGASSNGQLLSPLAGDEMGCNSVPLDDHNFCSAANTNEKNVLQLIRRGNCNFVDKASNQAARSNAAAMIVVNSSPNELFVMAGAELGVPFINDCSDEDLPLSVMVNGFDGESIMSILDSGKLKESRVEVNQILKGDKYFPYVTGSKEALQISARSGWATHAVRQTEGNGWQLFILRNDS